MPEMAVFLHRILNGIRFTAVSESRSMEGAYGYGLQNQSESGR